MTKKERLEVRLTGSEMTNLRRIQECGGFEDISSAVRFCVSFTKTMLNVLPASIAESYVQTEVAGNEEKESADLPDAMSN